MTGPDSANKHSLLLFFLLLVLPLWSFSANTSLSDVLRLMESARYDQALAALNERISSKNPTGLDYFFLGCVQNRREQFGEALDAFDEAQKRGYHAPTLELEVGFAQLRLNRLNDARRSLGTYLLRFPADQFASQLLAEAESTESGALSVDENRSNFRAWINSNLGYNNNPLAFSDYQTLPEKYNSKESAYLGINLGAIYQADPKEKGGFSASYRLSTRFYDEFDDFNSQWHRLLGKYRFRLQNKLGLTVSGGWNTYLLDNKVFRDQFQLGVQLVNRWSYHHRTYLNLTQYHNDYRFDPILPRLDRSGSQWQAELEHQWLYKQTRFEGALIAGGGDSKGSDYDHDRAGVSLGLTHWLPQPGFDWVEGRPVFSIDAAFTKIAYDNSSVFRPGKSRDDDVLRLGVMLQIPMARDLNAFVRCSRRSQSSSVAVFDYDQNNCSIGATHLFN